MPQTEFLTVPELADLLRIKERKVYDLAASGSVPCTRATGKLLFPEAEVRAWIESNQTGRKVDRPAVFLGSHDPFLEWALRQSECGLATYFDGSSDGLKRFAADEGIATGLHIPGANGWNTEAVQAECGQKNAVLISWAARSRGLVLGKGVTRDVRGIADLEGLRVAGRQASSGTAVLFARLLREAGSPRVHQGTIFHSEQDAVLAVADGEADVAFGLQAVARQFRLDFVPVVEERFDLLIDRKAYFEGPMQTFLKFCRSDAFRERAANQSGYVFDRMGDVVWNA